MKEQHDLIIENIPEGTLNYFLEFSENEFNNNHAFALKWLIDGIPNRDIEAILVRLEELESRIFYLENKEYQVQETHKTIKMLDGSERKVPIKQDKNRGNR